MKHILLASLALLLSLSLPANILRVNNTPGSSAEYSNLADAHDAASAGDTIHVEGSAISYGTFTVTKPSLTILGPGYFTTENECSMASLPATLQWISLQITVSNNYDSGSAMTKVRGLTIGQVYVYSNDNIIAQNYISDFIRFYPGVTRLAVSENFIDSNRDFAIIYTFSNVYSDAIITNNIISTGLALPQNSGGNVSHNLIQGDGFLLESFDGNIQSNIYASDDVAQFSVSTTGTGTVTHNTASSGQFGTENGNNQASPSDLFIGDDEGTTDGQYQLREDATAALENAHDGTDRGPFGGPSPYVLSGTPDIPVVLYLEVPATTGPSRPLNVTIRAKSGN
jgi:hypothetical protein